MSDREEVAKEVLEYIRTGLNDSAVADKFGYAYEGLQELFNELAEAGFMGPAARECAIPRKKIINAADLTADVRAGVSQAQLMEKYSLSLRELQKAFKKLAEAGSIELSEFPKDLLVLYKEGVGEEVRRETRHCLDFDLPVWEESAPEVHGQVLDVTERGIGIIGLPALVGEEKRLVVYSEEFFEIEAFRFAATCRWAKNVDGDGACVSGFQIVGINDRDVAELRKLIELLSV